MFVEYLLRMCVTLLSGVYENIMWFLVCVCVEHLYLVCRTHVLLFYLFCFIILWFLKTEWVKEESGSHLTLEKPAIGSRGSYSNIMIGIYLHSLKGWDFNFVTTQRKSTATCQRVGESWTFGCGTRQPHEAASAAPWHSWQDGFVPLHFTFSFRRKWTLFQGMLCLHMSNSQNKTQHFPQVSDDRIMKSRSNGSLFQISYQVHQ